MNLDYRPQHNDEQAAPAGRPIWSWGLLYRWGNPAVHGMDGPGALCSTRCALDLKGLPGAGRILLFNNGTAMGNRRFSTVDEITLPMLSDDGFFRGDGKHLDPLNPLICKDLPNSIQETVRCSTFAQWNTLICEGASGHCLSYARRSYRLGIHQSRRWRSCG